MSNVCAMALSAPKEQSGASTACIRCGCKVEKLKLFFLNMLFKFEYITQTDQTDLAHNTIVLKKVVKKMNFLQGEDPELVSI